MSGEMSEEERTVFEGQEVDGYQIMFRQFRGEVDIPLGLGEVVHLKLIAKVTHVDHKENQRNGLLIRDHEVKVLEVSIDNDD